MRYSTESRFRKYVKGYGLLSFARKCGNKYGKKLMDTVTKIEIDAAKIASKRIFQKTAETTGDLIKNKMADEISSIVKPKEKDKMYIPSEKDSKLLMTLDCLECNSMDLNCDIKMEFEKIANFLGTKKDLLLKNRSKFMINQKEVTVLTKKLESKHQC